MKGRTGTQLHIEQLTPAQKRDRAIGREERRVKCRRCKHLKTEHPGAAKCIMPSCKCDRWV